jgi:hypothetical protein
MARLQQTLYGTLRTPNLRAHRRNVLAGHMEVCLHLQSRWHPGYPRKRRPPSIRSGACAGALVHTDDDQVVVMVSPKHEDNTHIIIR